MRNSASAAGFTVVELIVILGLLAVGFCMLAPGMATTRPNSKAIQCLNNHRRLITSWKMYADDNADKVVNNFGATETQAEINGQTYRNWANNVLDWTSNQVNTNTGLLKVGIMSSYAGPAAAIYRCPADDYVSPSQHALGWNSRARSISMNGFFGAFDANTNGVWATGRNPIVSNYRQWLKIAQVNSPGRFFVTIDEHPDSINEGYFINNISGSPPSNWGDLPASLHNAGSTITFVDGRAEIHKWQSGTTRTPIRFFYNPSVFDSLGRADFQWLKDRSAVLY